MRKRQLTLEALEKRLVLSGVGQTDQAGPDWQSVIVSFNDEVDDPSAAAAGVMQTAGGHVRHVYQHALNGFSAELPAAAVEGLSHNPMVRSIEPNLDMAAFETTSTQVIPTGVDRVDAETTSVSASDVNVAIIDSGIDRDHPDLNVAGGINFVRPKTGPPQSRVADPEAYDDDNGHGTHVAGIVGAYDNDFGVVGVAPGARLWAVKVLASNGFGKLDDIIAGIDWVTGTRDVTDPDYNPDNEIDVVNMSIGGQGFSAEYRTAIQNSVAAGIVYVVAAGNEFRDIHGDDHVFGTSDDTIPAAYPEVATISAFADSNGMPGGGGDITSEGYTDDTYADFSNYSNSDGTENQEFLNSNPVDSPGLGIDLALPGVDIYSTYLDGGYAMSSGTSMAAPHATGLAARYIAEHGSASNAEGVYTIRQALIDGGIAWRSEDGLLSPPPGTANPDSPDRFEENLGWAGSSEPGDAPPNVTITAPTDGSTQADSVTITADATDDSAVVQVEFFVDGNSIGVDTDGDNGWTATWSTGAYGDGSYTITATATDDASQTANDVVTVTVDNVNDLPLVEITSPGNLSEVSGVVTVTADASDDRGVTQVEFSVDGISIGLDTNGDNGWAVDWDTTGNEGPHTISAVATDTNGGQATASVDVTVVAVQETSTHVADLDGVVKTVGKSGKWQVSVSVLVLDQDDEPVSGALVSGNWEGAWSGAASVLTDSNGWGTLSTELLLSGSSVTFNVTNVEFGTDTYDPEANVDPDPDSDGTSITLTNPTAASRNLTVPKPNDLDALAAYLASASQSGKQSKQEVADETAVIDLLMTYGL